MARKEKKYHFIYKTTNILSGRYYIGMHSTDNLEDGYLGSGNRLRLAIKKHGKENFKREILEFCETREELRRRESEIITLNEISKLECMNLVVGGEGGFISLSACTKGGLILQNKFKGSVEQKEWSGRGGSKTFNLYGIPKNLKQDWKGREHTEETKNKMSEAKKGKNIGSENSQYGTCWITKDGANKKIKKEDIETYLNEGWVKGRK